MRPLDTAGVSLDGIVAQQGGAAEYVREALLLAGERQDIEDVQDVAARARAADGEAIVKAVEDGDPGAPLEAAALVKLRAIREHSPADWARLRARLKKAGAGVTELERHMRGASSGADDESDDTTADRLIELARGQCELVHDEQTEPFAIVEGDGPRQVLGVQSSSYSDWLSHRYYLAHNRAPAESALRVALNTLRGQARFEGDMRPVHTRVAKNDRGYWLDLCDEGWQCIRITAEGWTVVAGADAPLFTRSPSMRPLPMPVSGGGFGPLWKTVNVPAPDRLMVLAWLLECLRPDTPNVGLEATGEAGTAKSSTQRNLRRLFDPNQADLRAAPKSTEDLFIAARNSHCVSIENLSHLSPQFQDAMCILLTGGGFAGRTLYTNAEETIFDLRRPVIVNGIAAVITAQDLLDRFLHLDLPKITDRRTEAELQAEFDAEHPRIVGALLDLFVKVLAELPKVSIDAKDRPRMADFAALGEAVFRAQGEKEGDFLARYRDMRREGVHRTIDSSPVGAALLAFGDRRSTRFTGTLTELLDLLEPFRPPGEAWPKSAKGLGDALRRLAPSLRLLGHECHPEPKTGGVIRWNFYFSGTGQPTPSPASPASPDRAPAARPDAGDSTPKPPRPGHAGHGVGSAARQKEKVAALAGPAADDAETFR